MNTEAAQDPSSSEPASRFLTGRQWTQIALGCLVFTVLAYLTPPSILESFDFIRMHELYKSYAIDALRSGHLPLWNPHVGLGRPFLADIETALLYPPGLLFVVLGAGIGFAALAALHVFLAVAGTAGLARHLGAGRPQAVSAGFAFAAGASVVLCFHSGQVQYSMALCWLPLVLWLVLRDQDRPSLRSSALLALALALQLLAGHPQVVWITGAGAAALLLARRLGKPLPAQARLALLDLIRLAGAAVLAALLAAVQLLPLYELIGQANRQTPSLAFSSYYAMPPYAWASVVVPPGPGMPLLTIYDLYAGLLVVLAGVAYLVRVRDRNARALLGLVVFAAVIAAGNSTPVFALLYRILPGLAAFRMHARTTALIALVLPVACALFLSARATGNRATTVALVLAGLGAAVLAAWAHRWGQLAGVVVAAVLLLLWTARPWSPRIRAGLAIALVMFVAGDLVLAIKNIKYTYPTPRPEFPAEAELTNALGARGLLAYDRPPPRISSPLVREDGGMLFGWSTFMSYGSLTLERVWAYLHAAAGVPTPDLDNTTPSLDIFRRGTFPYRTMNLVAGYDVAARRMVFDPSPDPRALVVARTEVVGSWREALSRLVAGHDGARIALAESGPPLGSDVNAAGASSAAIVSFAPERIELEVNSAVPGLLLIKEAWYPGWTATVNGEQARCQPANVWMRSVPVPAGRSEVVLSYRSTYFALGAAISLVTLALLLALLLLRRRTGAAALDGLAK
jgi:hypothetical protein